MLKHWEHTEYVSKETYELYLHHSVPIVPSIDIPCNTAVYVNSSSGGKRLEGVYDDSIKGIRKLRGSKDKAVNRDLRLYQDALQNENITVLAVDGLMGSGKTSTVIKSLVDSHLSKVSVSMHTVNDPAWKPDSEQRKILIAKPAVNSGGEEYGFLPGDINEKIIPTLRNYIQYFDKFHPSGFDLLSASGYVDILPLGFVRGMNAENMDLVVDECQNTKELITVATRRADSSRIFLLGDTSPFQIDLQGNTPKKNGLTDIIDLLSGAPYFQYIEMKSLEHIVRSTEVRDIVRRLFKKYGQDPQDWTV